MQIYDYRNDPEIMLSHTTQMIDELFNHATLVIYDIRSSIIPSALPDLPHVATYDQRIISLLNHATLVCSEPLDMSAIEFYRSIGLRAGSNIITLPHQSDLPLIQQILEDDVLCNTLASMGFERLVVFLPTPAAQILSAKLQLPLLNTYEISQQANDKVALKQYLIESNLPTIEGVITCDIDVIAGYTRDTDDYLIKLSHGVSGYGLFDTAENIDPLQILIHSQSNEVIIEKKDLCR